jgi:uncharacterized coiled-coil DUF342 family protein
MKLRDAYQQKYEAQIEELNARLVILRARARRLAADARIAAYEELADTDKKLAALKSRLARLRTAGDGAWRDMKGGVETAWNDLNKAAKRAVKRFGTSSRPRSR